VAAAYVAVCGPGDGADRAACEDAWLIGRALAIEGVVVVTGGLGGVMAAACRGAAAVAGVTVGLLPGIDRAAANPWVSVAVPTGMGELRNGLVVRAADVIVAIHGGSGTLSEVALALKLGKPVVGLGPWDLDGLEAAPDALSAAARANELACA
jgi:uncharacterized protein (TIGR00725 family)